MSDSNVHPSHARIVIETAEQTGGTTFRALKATSQATTPGAESAVCDCLVIFARINDGVDMTL